MEARSASPAAFGIITNRGLKRREYSGVFVTRAPKRALDAGRPHDVTKGGVTKRRVAANGRVGVVESSKAETEWAALMRAARAGDAAAYRRLFSSLAPILRGVARRDCAQIGLDAGEAEDIVQETLLAIHLKRDTWDAARPIAPWIMTIARHKLIDARRRRGVRAPLPIDEALGVAAAEASDEGLDRRDIDRLLGALGERQRELVRFLSLDGRSAKEAAERFGMSEGAVRVALHRAMRALAALYRGKI